MNLRLSIALLLLAGLALPSPALAGRVTVAVAANFAGTAQRLSDEFERLSGHEVDLVTGSTGKHFAQIVNGAPFDVLLAADRARPEKLEQQGLAVQGSRFTYALGRLVLWRPGGGVADGRAVLEAAAFRHLALANPRLAPYGAAARETLVRMKLWDALQDHLVFGESVGQAFHFVAAGSAELGFVALAQVRQAGAGPDSFWVVPETQHAAIEQQAVLLRDSKPAAAFLAFLRSAAGRALITAGGYGVPDVH